MGWNRDGKKTLSKLFSQDRPMQLRLIDTMVGLKGAL